MPGSKVKLHEIIQPQHASPRLAALTEYDTRTATESLCVTLCLSAPLHDTQPLVPLDLRVKVGPSDNIRLLAIALWPSGSRLYTVSLQDAGKFNFCRTAFPLRRFIAAHVNHTSYRVPVAAHRHKQIDIARETGVAINSVYAACKGESVNEDIAKRITAALGMKLEQAFTIQTDSRPLSTKTILEHHRLISTVLEQAVKEGLIPFNVAARATLPKLEKKEPAYFQPEQVEAIRDALEDEPIRWKTLIHLLLITGARRGEILGLKWESLDFKNNRIRICNNILYSVDRGVYESTPKTETSNRLVALPLETMRLLQEYRAWQYGERIRLGKYFKYQGFVFSQDNGNPIHPDSVNDWLNKFSARHGLPHLNPHAFRHTMASLLYFNKVDSVSISKRLGHAQVSTTANIYAHVMEQADQMSADILADVILKKA